MSTRGADALTRAADQRAANDRVRNWGRRDYSGLSEEGALSLAVVDGSEAKAAARVVVRIASRLGAGRGDCLRVLQALGLAGDSHCGREHKTDMGLRSKKRQA